MHKQNFQALETIIEGGKLPQQTQLTPIQAVVEAVISKNKTKFQQMVKSFLHILSEHKSIFLNQDTIVANFDSIKFMICKNNKLFTYKEQCRAILLVGKTINVYKWKKSKQQAEQAQGKSEFCTLVQQGVLRLIQDGKWILPKAQKEYQINDILLQHDMPDATVSQVQISNEVISPFVPVQRSIVMLIPYKTLKPICLNFLKSSILHTFIDQAQLLSKIVSVEHFYKNSTLKGIYFIEEGEVQVTSGRVIARGWTTYGKCKVSGIGWKFKPIPFIKFLVRSSPLWKQFMNDIKLNQQYPFNIIHILSLDDEDDFTSKAQWKSLGRKKLGSKSPKLPKITNRSMDQSKYQEIQKLRHYDNRINDIFLYKQDLLTRKLKGIIHGKFQPIYRDQKSEMKLQKKKELLKRINSKKSEFSKRETQPDTHQPSQNILIMSVLKRLESIADMNQTQRRRDFSVSYTTPQQFHSKVLPTSKSKKQYTKMLPMQMHERSKYQKKSRRYY